MPCSYCGIGGHGVDKCPNRLEEKFGTGDDFDDDDKDIRTDGGTLRLDGRHWMPTGKTDTQSPHACRNCGSQHTRQYVRVYGSNDNTLWHCHDCDEPEICGRDMKQGAGTDPDYDPAADRGETTDQFPLFSSGGTDS